MDNKVLDIIIDFINGVKHKENSIISENNGDFFAIRNAYYLLGQILRQTHIPISHYFVSAEAKKLWMTITDEPFMKHWYHDKITITKNCEVVLKKYVGASKTPQIVTARKNDSFVFRDVFHDEHMVSIKNIIEELLELEKPDYKNVAEILDKIYICRMLKSEDRSINGKYNRGLDYNEVINNYYKPCGIEVINLSSWDERF